MELFKARVLEKLESMCKPGFLNRVLCELEKRDVEKGLPDYVAKSVSDLAANYERAEEGSKIYLPSARLVHVDSLIKDYEKSFKIRITDGLAEMDISCPLEAPYCSTKRPVLQSNYPFYGILYTMASGDEMQGIVLDKISSDSGRLWLASFDRNFVRPTNGMQRVIQLVRN